MEGGEVKEYEFERGTLVVVPRIGAKQFMGNRKEAFLGQTVSEGHYQ